MDGGGVVAFPDSGNQPDHDCDPAPVFSYLLYPFLDRFFAMTPLRKISIGLFVMVPGFAMVSFFAVLIDSGQTPSISWQLLAYVLLTASEVMVSITCLEFAYTQAPTSMKSVVMAMFLASVSLGNYFTAAVNKFILIEKGDSAPADQRVRQDLGYAELGPKCNYFEMHQEQLLRTEEGQALVGEMLDPWGSPSALPYDQSQQLPDCQPRKRSAAFNPG